VDANEKRNQIEGARSKFRTQFHKHGYSLKGAIWLQSADEIGHTIQQSTPLLQSLQIALLQGALSQRAECCLVSTLADVHEGSGPVVVLELLRRGFHEELDHATMSKCKQSKGFCCLSRDICFVATFALDDSAAEGDSYDVDFATQVTDMIFGNELVFDNFDNARDFRAKWSVDSFDCPSIVCLDGSAISRDGCVVKRSSPQILASDGTPTFEIPALPDGLDLFKIAAGWDAEAVLSDDEVKAVEEERSILESLRATMKPYLESWKDIDDKLRDKGMLGTEGKRKRSLDSRSAPTGAERSQKRSKAYGKGKGKAPATRKSKRGREDGNGRGGGSAA
jgi:hypothetical protein